MTRIRSAVVLVCAALLGSCSKNAVQDITGPIAGGRVKFFNFGVSAPGVNFYANDTKMTAISSTTGTESTTGTAYGKAAAGGNYTAIAPGSYTLSGRITAATDKDLAIAKLPTTLGEGKWYSFYLSGIYDPTAKTVDAFIVDDPFPAQRDYSVAYVRFVNAVANADPLTLYARGSATQEVAVGAAVPYKGAGAFTAVPNGVYDLSARSTGVTPAVITRTGASFSAGKVYTVSAGGDITSATASTKPFLDNSINR